MHPFLTPELACNHEKDLRRELAAARGPARRRARRFAPTALALLVAPLLAAAVLVS
jgi:hypothetical protein